MLPHVCQAMYAKDVSPKYLFMQCTLSCGISAVERVVKLDDYLILMSTNVPPIKQLIHIALWRNHAMPNFFIHLF